MRYGYFDDTAKEYVITRPDTPLPWLNYLGSEDFFGLVTHTGGGYSFFRDARLRRLTRYRYNDVPSDTGSRFLYVRDDASGAYWTPTWKPIQKPVEGFRCRHGLGYTTIESSTEGIATSVRYFVPAGERLEVWQVSVTNRREKPAELSVFAGVEFCLWDAWDDATNFQRNYNTGEVEIADSVIYHKTEYRERRDHFAYFACSEPAADFDTQREAFLGTHRGWDRPLALEQGRCSNSLAHGWAPIGMQRIALALKPGETHEIRFLLGYWENPRSEKFDPPESLNINRRGVSRKINEYLDRGRVESAFADMGRAWEQRLDAFQVTTPDVHTNRMVNIWNAYQCMITFNLSRSASLFESGIGRGMGFRDSNQDILGFVHMIPDRARQRILDLAATQLESGGAFHQYQPLTKRGNNDIGSNFNDDPHWLVLSTAAYIKESGDWSILEERIPFQNLEGTEAPLYEHLVRCIRYTLDRLGPHGLPLIGRADWNDCLNLNCFSDTPGESFQTTTNHDDQVAESVFIAGLFVLSAGEMAEMARKRGKAEEARLFAEEATIMRGAIDGAGCDGDWFLRAYDAYGHPVGSKDSREGQLFIEPQGMCVMAGVGIDDGRALNALDAVRTRLATPHGIVLLQPPYSKYLIHMGEISSYAPGYKENGSVFCHTNPWVMIAETRVGRGDLAHDYYLRINPSSREELSDIHRCEPYVYAQTIAGRDAPSHGEAKNSWLTGAAAWNYVAISQWILGVRPTYDGLRIAPVIPDHWKGFTARRRYRGATYEIDVQRVGPGPQTLVLIEDKPCDDGVIPAAAAGCTAHIRVLLGVRS